MIDAKLINYYKAQYEDTTELSDDEIPLLLAGLNNHDEEAKNRLIGSHIKMIVSIASKYSMPSDDLIHEGIIGLLSAAKKFKPEQGTKFSTFSYMYIQHNMVEFMSTFSNSVRIPSRKYGLMKQVDMAQIQALEELGRQLTTEELAEVLDKSPQLIKNVLEEMKLRECQDLIPEIVETNDMHPNAVLEADKHERLNEILGQLSPRDEYVLRFKYGIGDKNAKIRTDEEIATIFQISAKSVVPIEERALQRLKHYPEIIEMLQG